MASKKVIFGPYRCVFPTLAEPKSFVEGDAGKYGIKILIPKSDKAGYKKVLDFITESVNECGEWKAPVKAQVIKTAKDFDNGANDNCILKDGDLINEQRVNQDKTPVEAYAGNWVISASRKASFGAPLVVGKDAQQIPGAMIDALVQPGYHVNTQVSAYCYSKPKFGITLQLQAVQLVKEDAVFGRENPFGAVESDDASDGESEDGIPF